MQAKGRAEVYPYSFLTSALDWVVTVVFPPAKNLSNFCTGGWVGPRAGLDS